MFLEIATVTGNAIDLGNVTSAALNASTGVVELLGKVGKWLEAIGIIILVVVVIQIGSFFMNLVKTKRLGELNERMERVEDKLDTLLSKKKINF